MAKKEYIEREGIARSMKYITDDTTCPTHIAAYIDQIIAQEPTADVAEVRHGHWDVVMGDKGIFDYYFVCSECHGCTPPSAFVIAPDYCPYCGTYMSGKGEG